METNGREPAVEKERLEDSRQPARRVLCRGIRGATTVSANDADEILEATRELLTAMVSANGIAVQDIASIHLTTTVDLDATYPAYAARQLGWFDAALLCGHEMVVPDGLERCIRVLMHWNTDRLPSEIIHVYQKDARSLRPDRDNIPPIRPRQMSAVDAALKMIMLTL